MSLVNIADIMFPWDKLHPYTLMCAEFTRNTGRPIIDVSIGEPIDSVPLQVQQALVEQPNMYKYPATIGSPHLKNALYQWLRNYLGEYDVKAVDVIPTIGSKEAVAFLPSMLGITDGIVVRPEFAYPTYDVGAKVANLQVLQTDDVTTWRGNPQVKLVWLNYPNNPTGKCTSVEYLQEVVQAAREIGAVVVSDECYAYFDWRVQPQNGQLQHHPSLLDPIVTDGDYTNLLILYSFSKQLNLAGYRTAFLAGDRQIVQRIGQIRKHMGLMLPAPVQNAMAVALEDVEETIVQHKLYRKRYSILRTGLADAGYEIEHSEGSLYVWAKAKTGNCWQDLEQLAVQGILVAPGEFYDSKATNYLRFSITARIDQIIELVERLI